MNRCFVLVVDCGGQYSNTPVLQYSNTPSLRLTEVEDEDDDKDSDSTELAEVLPDVACGL